jgi:hypothetical protein
VVGTATVAMGRDVYIGAEVLSAQYAVWVTVSFDHVLVSGAGSADGVLDRSDWTVWASEYSYDEPASNAIDGDLTTRFTTGAPQHDSQGFRVSWPGERIVSRIRIDLGASPGDEPRACGMWLADLSGTSTFVTCVPDAAGTIDVSFPPVSAHQIEVWQWGTADNWWSIAEFNAYSVPADRELQ